MCVFLLSHVYASTAKAEVIVVGDIHGCHSEMVSLLERCGYRLGNRADRERFSVVLAGDLVNKARAIAVSPLHLCAAVVGLVSGEPSTSLGALPLSMIKVLRMKQYLELLIELCIFF